MWKRPTLRLGSRSVRPTPFALWATEFAGVLPAEHMHFMIDSAKAVDMLIDSVVTPLVTQSDQALHHAITEVELIAGGLESGKWTDGLQKTSVWTDLVSVQATTSKAVNNTTISDKLAKLTKARESHPGLLDSFGLVLAEVQMARATDVVAKGKLTLSGRTIARLVETHMSDRTVGSRVVPQESP